MGRRSRHFLQLCDLACKPVITHFSADHFIPVTKREAAGFFKAERAGWTQIYSHYINALQKTRLINRNEAAQQASTT
jgi:hypothetical protein